MIVRKGNRKKSAHSKLVQKQIKFPWKNEETKQLGSCHYQVTFAPMEPCCKQYQKDHPSNKVELKNLLQKDKCFMILEMN